MDERRHTTLPAEHEVAMTRNPTTIPAPITHRIATDLTKPVLVTGATGLVGNNLVRCLLDQGQSVRVLVRTGADARPLEGLNVEAVRGDVRDRAAVERACEGVQAVLHAAALIHLGWTQRERAREINVQGTRHLVEAARRIGARLVHVSSVDALGAGSVDRPADEENYSHEKVPCTYVLTKRESDQVVRQGVRDGLDAVIVHPGFMLGPWDWKPSSGRMLLAVAQQFTPVAPPGGCTVCDIRDVARGILAAWRSGRIGRSYILGGDNLRYLELWKLFAAVTGASAPSFRVGPLMRYAAGLWGDLRTRISGREPDVNSAAIAMSCQYHYYSSARAQTELDYRCRPVRESVQDAWQWFQKFGYA